MATADEASTTLILYLSPQPHHVPGVSPNSITDMSAELNVEPVGCNALPTSSEPLHSYVVTTVTSAVEDDLQHASDDVSAKRELGVRSECVSEHSASDCNASGSVQNALTVESAEATVSTDQSIGPSKVFSVIQATLSSDMMSVIIDMHCWDVLVTAAEACSVQLLHDANCNVYVAVGSTLNSFCELERILLTLCDSIMAYPVTDKTPVETAAVHSPDDNLIASSSSSSSSSAAATIDSTASVSQTSVTLNSDGKCDKLTLATESADGDQQLKTSSQVSVACEAVDRRSTSSQQVSIDSNENKTEPMNQQFTRSGRPVKSKNFADFVSSDTLRSGLAADKTTLKRRRGRPCKPRLTATAGCQDKQPTTVSVSCTDNVEDFSDVKESVTNQQPSASDASPSQQHVDGSGDQQSERATCDAESDITIANGGTKQQQIRAMTSGSLYNGRTRLESREYEQLMPYQFCTQCSFMSKRDGHMKRHMELHARGVSVLKCSQCSYRTTRSNHVTRHQLRQHSQMSVSCTVDGCMFVTSSERLLQKHVTSRHVTLTKSSTFPCPVSGCTYTATTETRLLRHKARHRSVDGQSSVSDTDLVECYQCTQCAYQTTQREHFRRHVDSVHHNLRPFLCDVCGQRFKRHDALLQHTLVHSDQTNTRFNVHRCDVCQRTFRSKSHLSDHEAVHSSRRSFQCHVCGASFKTRAVQRKHLLTIHSHPGAHVCHTCGRLFNTSFAMKRHSRMHQMDVNTVDLTAAASSEPTTLYLQPTV